MKWFNRLFLVISGLLSFRAAKTFLDNYEVVIFDKNDLAQDEEDSNPYSHAMDLRGTPTHLCPCGCNIWNVRVIFDDYEIATYFLEMECANCGSMATAPTPLDREKME